MGRHMTGPHMISCTTMATKLRSVRMRHTAPLCLAWSQRKKSGQKVQSLRWQKISVYLNMQMLT